MNILTSKDSFAVACLMLVLEKCWARVTLRTPVTCTHLNHLFSPELCSCNMGGAYICVCGELKLLFCWWNIVISFCLLLNIVRYCVSCLLIRSNQYTVRSYPRNYSITSSPALLLGLCITLKSTELHDLWRAVLKALSEEFLASYQHCFSP